jgi:flagellin
MKVKQPDGGAVSYIAADVDALKTAAALTSTYGINGATAFTTASNLTTAGGSVYSATRGHILNYAQKVTYTSAGDDTGLLITVLGENIDGSIISETIEGTAANSEVSTLNNFKAIKTITFSKTNTGTSSTLGLSGYTTEFAYHGARTFGDFEISHSATGTSLLDGQTASTTATGDLDTKDSVLAAAGENDSATVQGTISLKSSKIFSVTQSGTEEALGSNDNYFTTKAAALDTVSNVDLRTQAGADGAIAVLDGAIEKISSMRSDLGAIENRLEHTVSNLMNIGENTEAARSRIQDADFAAESAKLAKAQVLKQAGVGMLSQANAGAQLVLQLLQ